MIRHASTMRDAGSCKARAGPERAILDVSARKTMTLYRATCPRTTCGYVVCGGVVIKAAPYIYRRVIGKTEAEAYNLLRGSGWSVEKAKIDLD